MFVGADHGNLAHVKATVDRLGLADRVHFLGFVPREDLIDLYRQAFALSYVTFFGPENLPPLEAFALGCPVIASEVSGAREQLEDAVLFVDPTSPEQMAEAVVRLASEEGLRAETDRRRAERLQTPERRKDLCAKRWLFSIDLRRFAAVGPDETEYSRTGFGRIGHL